MTPNMMRQLWSLIESSQSRHILELDDYSLVNWLISQMKNRQSVSELSIQDGRALERYIRDHLLLIRDIADETQIAESGRAAMASC